MATKDDETTKKLMADNAQLRREVDELKRRLNEQEREAIRREARDEGYRSAVRDLGATRPMIDPRLMDPMMMLYRRGGGGW